MSTPRDAARSRWPMHGNHDAAARGAGWSDAPATHRRRASPGPGPLKPGMFRRAGRAPRCGATAGPATGGRPRARPGQESPQRPRRPAEAARRRGGGGPGRARQSPAGAVQGDVKGRPAGVLGHQSERSSCRNTHRLQASGAPRCPQTPARHRQSSGRPANRRNTLLDNDLRKLRSASPGPIDLGAHPWLL